MVSGKSYNQNNEYTSLENNEMEPLKPVQTNIYIQKKLEVARFR